MFISLLNSLFVTPFGCQAPQIILGAQVLKFKLLIKLSKILDFPHLVYSEIELLSI